jgi:hypothetical protein
VAIPIQAFYLRSKLRNVELHDGIRGIGDSAFHYCKALRELHVPDRVEVIGDAAFSGCTRFTKFRCPPLVTTMGMLGGCKNMVSLEVPEIIIEVERYAFSHCYSLRNIALASNSAVGENAFHRCQDLLEIFGTEEAVVNALKIRFNGLLIHSKMYYISYYNQMTAEEILNTIINDETGDLDPTGLQQDCLGMIPLHILVCSTVQRLELYQLLVEKYSDCLIVKDSWGVEPLLAIWGDAPSEIIEFLVNSYQSLYPNYEFDWIDMLVTLGQANASVSVMQNLLDVQQTLSPGYTIMWEQALDALAEETGFHERQVSPETLCFLVRCRIATRVNAIGVKHFRDAMADDWMVDDWWS